MEELEKEEEVEKERVVKDVKFILYDHLFIK
jgi:hypothetical protein